MTEGNAKSKFYIGIIIDEALRKLNVLSWCSLNQQLFDSTETFCIAELLHDKKQGLHEIQDEITGCTAQQSLTALSCANNANVLRDSSSSGEDRVFYDRFEYLDRCKELRQLRKRLRILKFQYHDVNQKLHEKSQIEMTKQRFIQSWEASRKEQLQHTISNEVDKLRIERTMLALDKTRAVQAAVAIDKFYLSKLRSTEQQVEDWMDRFDREKEDQDARFQKAHATEKDWSELKNVYEQQQTEIKALEMELETWEKQMKHKELCGRMATQIQAWWRGVIVRKRLRNRFGRAVGQKNKGKEKAQSQKQNIRKKEHMKKVINV